MVFPRVMSTAKVTVDDGGEYGSGGAETKKMKKKGSGKKLLRIFKAILFETSLAKKLKKRRLIKKQKQGSKRTQSASSEYAESYHGSTTSQETMDMGSGRILSSTNSSSSGFSSNSSAITSSSTRSSSVSSHSKCSSDRTKLFSDLIKSLSDRTKSFTDRNKSLYDKTKSFFDRNKSIRLNTFQRSVPMKLKKQDNMPMQETGKGFYGSNVGLCFLLISLFVLVLWGKFCAIFCTSTWLFLVPLLSTAKNPFNRSPQLDSDYNKKIIIDQGLLESRNSHGR